MFFPFVERATEVEEFALCGQLAVVRYLMHDVVVYVVEDGPISPLKPGLLGFGRDLTEIP